MFKGCKEVCCVRQVFRTEKQPTEILRRMLNHKTHGVYAKSYARKKVVVLAFRAEKVQRSQGVLRPHQAGGGIYGLPLRLTRKYHGERNNKRAVTKLIARQKEPNILTLWRLFESLFFKQPAIKLSIGF